MNGDVSIVIPVWNQAELLHKLLSTIAAQSVQPREVIVVDNGSTDDAAETARKWGATVIAMGRNTGFACAANRGITECRSYWTGLINTDVELNAEWLQKLTEVAHERDAWFAGGKILMASDPERLDGSFDLIARSGLPWRAGHGRLDCAAYNEQREVRMIPATAALYRRELFDRVGYFAEVYGSYLEDVDLALRCASAGLKGIYVPDAICRHRGSASSGAWSKEVVYQCARNQIILRRRLFPIDLQIRWVRQCQIGQWLWALIALRHGRLWSWWLGHREGLKSHVEFAGNDANKFAAILEDSERELARLQRLQGMDLYWRLYFLFTGGESH